MARPQIEVTDKDRRLVKTLGRAGVPQQIISDLVCGGISLNTLKKHFSYELTVGKAFANYIVAKTLFNKAMAGDTTALIFWAKTQMDWRVNDGKVRHCAKSKVDVFR